MWYNTYVMQHRNALKSSQKVSLIDIVSQGFYAVNRCVWVLLIPITIDLFYWLGPRVSIAPLLAQLRSLNPQAWDQAQEQLGAQIIEQLSTFDLRYMMLLNPLQPLIPNLEEIPTWFTPSTWQVHNIGSGLGVIVIINLVALIFAVLYLLPLATAISEKKHQIDPRRFTRALTSLLGVAGIIIGVVMLASLLTAVVSGILMLVLEPLGLLVFFASMGLLLWFLFVVSFSFDAVVVSGLGPLRAMWSSFWVVQRSLLSAIGLWLLSLVIVGGMGIIWRGIATESWLGLLVAIVGSAYITSGMAAAHLAFYRNRQKTVTSNG